MNIRFINERKKALGLTNQMIADQTGITLSTLEKITSGVNANPKLSTMKAIAKVLECKLDDFDDIDNADENSRISIDEMLFVDKFRALDTHGKAVVNAVLDLEYKRCGQSPETVAPPETITGTFASQGRQIGSLSAPERSESAE